MAADTLVDQVLAQVRDARTRLAMLMGAALEGGWGPTYGVGDQGTSFGPFQIHLPDHPQVTAAQATDPRFAVGFMLPAYQQAVGRVPARLWSANPEAAAEQAAYLAERPAVDYYTSEGGAAVHAAYQQAAAAAKGGGGGHWYDWLNPIHDVKALGGAIGGAAGDAAGAVAGGVADTVWPDVKRFSLTLAGVGLGVTLILIGSWQATSGARRRATQTVTELSPAAAGSGQPSGGGGAAASEGAGGGAALPEAAAAAAV